MEEDDSLWRPLKGTADRKRRRRRRRPHAHRSGVNEALDTIMTCLCSHLWFGFLDQRRNFANQTGIFFSKMSNKRLVIPWIRTKPLTYMLLAKHPEPGVIILYTQVKTCSENCNFSNICVVNCISGRLSLASCCLFSNLTEHVSCERGLGIKWETLALFLMDVHWSQM